ncbi:hypothetical protein [Actinomycetospora cinnamomea]|uniref:hypothetical protein n=1 Tax=Actinomycetospora cinnamomea TaxID=663609 RepID=UPI001057C16E|nr:hypothetical protein [Actinomycetospora cinnamomea]
MSDTETPVLRWGRLRLDVEPGVYGTVVLMTVLVVALDDGVEDFPEAAQVIVGPLVATFAAHLFAAVLARFGRRSAPSRAEIRHLVASAAQFLLLGVVPLLVVAVGAASGLYTPDGAAEAILGLGLAFLVLVGGIGGWRTGRGAGAAVLGALAAGVLGLVVLLLRLVLEHW